MEVTQVWRTAPNSGHESSGYARSVRSLLRIVALMCACAAVGLGATSASAAPVPMYTGVYISNMQDVNLDSSSFSTDFSMWFRWTGPKNLNPAASLELMNAIEARGTMVTPISTPVKRLKDGAWYSVTHYQSRFNSNFALQGSPFSAQGRPRSRASPFRSPLSDPRCHMP